MRVSRIDLKFRLALSVAALAALCFAVAVVFALLVSNRSARMRADGVAQVVANAIALQEQQAHWVKGPPDVSSGLQAVALAVTDPGLCISYRAPDGNTLQQLCRGPASDQIGVPRVFSALYGMLFGSGIQAAYPIVSHGTRLGEAVASINPQSLIGQSWHETRRLAAVMAAVLFGLCVLVYGALAVTLRPTRAIRSGLERLSAGDLSVRLPRFDLAELSSIGDVFNQLANNLEMALAERNALTRQLIAVQDEERRNLARELHDEFGQCLAAISAVAASIGQVAEHECPSLVCECTQISRTTARMMEALRGTLLRLRPPDVEELGLPASLEGLIAGWNSAGGDTRFSIELLGDFDGLSREFTASLYRVAQEAITNAAKHAQASRVNVRLRVQEPIGVNQGGRVELVVADDGKARPELAVKPGMGLLGMGERIAALGGRLSLATSLPSGLVLRAEIPVPSTWNETRDAA